MAFASWGCASHPRHALGQSFESIEIDSSPGNPHGIPSTAHSVLTVDFVDEPEHPPRAALDHVLAFLHQQLLNYSAERCTNMNRVRLPWRDVLGVLCRALTGYCL